MVAVVAGGAQGCADEGRAGHVVRMGTLVGGGVLSRRGATEEGIGSGCACCTGSILFTLAACGPNLAGPASGTKRSRVVQMGPGDERRGQ